MIYGTNELLIYHMNKIILNSIMHGADTGGTYDSNREGLYNSMTNFLEDMELEELYKIENIDRNTLNEVWNVPQFVRKDN